MFVGCLGWCVCFVVCCWRWIWVVVVGVGLLGWRLIALM